MSLDNISHIVNANLLSVVVNLFESHATGTGGELVGTPISLSGNGPHKNDQYCRISRPVFRKVHVGSWNSNLMAKFNFSRRQILSKLSI